MISRNGIVFGWLGEITGNTIWAGWWLCPGPGPAHTRAGVCYDVLRCVLVTWILASVSPILMASSSLVNTSG